MASFIRLEMESKPIVVVGISLRRVQDRQRLGGDLVQNPLHFTVRTFSDIRKTDLVWQTLAKRLLVEQ